MLACTLALALALSPEPATASAQGESGELPHWQSVPEPPPKPSAKPPSVPKDGAGLITLGSFFLGGGATLGFTSVGLTLANDPSTRTAREVSGIASGISLGSAAVLLTLGLVVRQQFRNSPAGNIPDAPRPGGGMLLGGLGLILGGTIFAAHAIVDMSILTCSGSRGCYRTRPIGAPVQLGLALGSMVVGTGLLIGGVQRRKGYQRWARQRAQLQPSLGMGPTSFTIGLSGRF
jgi:hypothetical protein